MMNSGDSPPWQTFNFFLRNLRCVCFCYRINWHHLHFSPSCIEAIPTLVTWTSITRSPFCPLGLMKRQSCDFRSMFPSVKWFDQLPGSSPGVATVRWHGTGEMTVLSYFCYSFTIICRPLHSNGTKYHPEELLQAFTELLLSFPQCPCANLDPNPGDDHNVKVWVIQTGRHAGSSSLPS